MSDITLTPVEIADLRGLAATMIPASAEFGVPGADDPVIFADILRSLGRDFADVRATLSELRSLSGGAFASLPEARREALVAALHERGGTAVVSLGRALLTCYYRDDCVIRSLGLEPRPPFPLGHTLEQGDWSLLDPVKARAKLWRDAP